MVSKPPQDAHPWALNAVAAGWSLRRSVRELFRVGLDEDGDRGTLRSAAPSSGRSASGHGDPVGNVVLRAAGSSREHLVDQVADDVLAARWLTRSDPHRRPATARDVAGYLGRADQRIRTALGMPADHRPMPGNPICPGCGSRLLRIWSSAPDARYWVVVCLAGCRCAGASCGCGMAVLEHGAPHIWPGDSPLVTAHLQEAA